MVKLVYFGTTPPSTSHHQDYYIFRALFLDIWMPIGTGTGIPTTIKTMGVNITTIVYLRVLIIESLGQPLF